MNKDFNKMLKDLTEWVKWLKEMAEKDEALAVSWFGGTEDEKFNIVGGWSEGFSEDYSDILHISKSNPSYAMCIKVVVNEGPYAYADYDSLNMPANEEGEVDDTCIALELDDDPEATALFYLNEWERISKEYKEM